MGCRCKAILAIFLIWMHSDSPPTIQYPQGKIVLPDPMVQSFACFIEPLIQKSKHPGLGKEVFECHAVRFGPVCGGKRILRQRVARGLSAHSVR